MLHPLVLALAIWMAMGCVGAIAESVPGVIENSIGMKLVRIPAGEFLMGSNGPFDDEKPIHRVQITQPFLLGQTEVTNAQWKRVMGSIQTPYSEEKLPVGQVSWDDAINFCTKLSDLPEERQAGRVYRLPTEAEWEYACRAGTTTRYSFGNDESELGEYAWYGDTQRHRAQELGTKKPNPWGLHDMHGNVWEWCSDGYGDYGSAFVVDPQGLSEASARVYRGGAWYNSPWLCRSAHRHRLGEWPSSIDLGFRVAASQATPERLETGQ